MMQPYFLKAEHLIVSFLIHSGALEVINEVLHFIFTIWLRWSLLLIRVILLLIW